MCCSKSECSLAIIMQKTLQSIFIHLSVLLLNLVLRERRIMAQGTFIRRMNGESRNLRSHRIRGWNKICHSISWSYEKGENLIYSTKTGLFLKCALLFIFLLQIQVGHFLFFSWFLISNINQDVIKFDQLNYIYLFY